MDLFTIVFAVEASLGRYEYGKKGLICSCKQLNLVMNPKHLTDGYYDERCCV